LPEPSRRLEFRIPISPTEGFFAQIRFFNFALRRLAVEPYRDARLVIVVGDHCDLDNVRRQNRWSENFNIVWERVPDAVFSEFGVWGTANWRLSLPAGDADIVVLSDADTVLLRDVDPAFASLPTAVAAVRGHMAYRPPRLGNSDGPPPESREYWPWLFERFNIAWPSVTYSYSQDRDASLPEVPAYFNLGFVVLNPKALSIFGSEIAQVHRRVHDLTGSIMRCQIAVTIIAYRAAMDIGMLPAAYNAGNDIEHLALNRLMANQIRVLHYLKDDEIERSEIFLPRHIDQFLARSLSNPANIELQKLARSYRETLR
jgi:hypothetical protein